MATNQYAPAPAINLAAPTARAMPQNQLDVQGGYGQGAAPMDRKNKVSSYAPTVGTPLSNNQPGLGTGGPLMPGQPTGLIGSKMLTR